MKPLSEAKIRYVLEELVSDGIIAYGPREVIEENHEGYPIEFRIYPSLLKKQPTVGASLPPPFDTSRKWAPASDFYCPDERLIIARPNNTHDLTLNLFCVDKPQLLLLTVDAYERQYGALDRDDFAAALEVLRHLPNMYIIYNCDKAAGCSRLHKHTQVFPGPPKAFKLFEGPLQNPNVPFRYFVHQSVQSRLRICFGFMLRSLVRPGAS